MSTVHRVSQGECLSSIAMDYGFANWKAIYDHPANAALKARSPNPNALVPGDRVVIPDPIPKTGKYALGAWHELRVKNPPTTLRLQLRDMSGKAFANAPYRFEIGNEQREGTTDGDGVLKEDVDPSLTQARVILRPGNPDYPEEIRWQLELGTLDDASTVSGAQGRLRNLGYYTGPVDGRLSEETRFALRAFQRENELEVSGRLERATVDKLQAIHDAVNMTQDIIKAFVALTGDALSHINSLVQPFEERQIILAQGKQFRNGDRASPWSMPSVLRLSGADRADITMVSHTGATFKLGELWPSLKKLPAIALEDAPGGTFQFTNAAQGVRFTIKVVNTKDAFITALKTPGAHVVYSGHARFGRGPCFGAGGDGPGEMWEEGTSAQDGIFRMGFPFIAVDVHDLAHGYTANLAPADVKLAAADCDPDLRNLLGTLKGRTLAEISAAIPPAEPGDPPNQTPKFRNSDPNQKFWTVGSKSKLQMVVIAGWLDTISKPSEIGAFDPTCRVFVHMACSTFKHNHPVVRKLKGWKHDGNERYAYWTTDLSDAIGDHYWLQHILAYDQFNAFQPWEKSLEFAKNKSNALLARDGERFRFI